MMGYATIVQTGIDIVMIPSLFGFLELFRSNGERVGISAPDSFLFWLQGSAIQQPLDRIRSIRGNAVREYQWREAKGILHNDGVFDAINGTKRFAYSDWIDN